MEIKNIYTNKDGRTRAYYIDDKGKSHVVSYPRILMMQKLGRSLEPYEDVHHIDGNPMNNNLNNLEVINHGDHQKFHMPHKYYDKETICDVCGKKFIWSSIQQRRYYTDLNRNKNRIISCSKRCSALYGRREQLRRDSKAECELNGEASPNGNTVPNI